MRAGPRGCIASVIYVERARDQARGSLFRFDPTGYIYASVSLGFHNKRARFAYGPIRIADCSRRLNRDT